MAIYSCLVLAANVEVRPPSPSAFRTLLSALNLLDGESTKEDHGNLADHVGALFHDAEARAENDRFFFPNGIGHLEELEIQSPEGDYFGPGWCIDIHGWGYFYPWSLADLRDRVTNSPSLVRLKQAVEREYGGWFVFPTADEKLLRSRLIDASGEWAWFASESF